MADPEKLATYGTQDEDKQSRETGNKTKTKQKHNTICVGNHYMETDTHNLIKHGSSYNQLEVKTN